MSTLRDTILAEEEIVASKRRFGLFSQPPPLAVGDDSSFRASSRTFSIIQFPEETMESRSRSLLNFSQGRAKLAK